MTEQSKIPAPYPCGQSSHICPYTIRCGEIDAAAMLIRDPEAFAAAAASDKPDTRGLFFERPTRRFAAEGGCPYYQGLHNWGSGAAVQCQLTPVRMHDYIEVKFCEGGRKIYCPIYRAHEADKATERNQT